MKAVATVCLECRQEFILPRRSPESTMGILDINWEFHLDGKQPIFIFNVPGMSEGIGGQKKVTSSRLFVLSRARGHAVKHTPRVPVWPMKIRNIREFFIASIKQRLVAGEGSSHHDLPRRPHDLQIDVPWFRLYRWLAVILVDP